MSKLWWNAGELLQGMFSRSTAHTQLAPAQYASPLKTPFHMNPEPILISQWWSINPYVTCLQTNRINNWKRKAVERWLGREAPRGKWGQAFREKKVIDYEERQMGGIAFPPWVGWLLPHKLFQDLVTYNTTSQLLLTTQPVIWADLLICSLCQAHSAGLLGEPNLGYLWTALGCWAQMSVAGFLFLGQGLNWAMYLPMVQKVAWLSTHGNAGFQVSRHAHGTQRLMLTFVSAICCWPKPVTRPGLVQVVRSKFHFFIGGAVKDCFHGCSQCTSLIFPKICKGYIRMDVFL